MKRNNSNKTSRLLESRLDLHFRLFLEGIFIGLLTGLIIVLYRIMLIKVEALREKAYYLMQTGSVWVIPLWFLALLVLGYGLGRACKKDPLIGGSGIPQVKGVLWGKIKINWLRVLTGKFIGSILAVGGGLSLGRGAPSIQMGAACAQGLSRLLGRFRIEEKYLITCGASAGLAAAFGAPLTGVIFALEEMQKSISPILLSSAMVASLAADLIAQHFLGQKPIFYFQNLPIFPLEKYHYLIILGLFMGLLGFCFNKCLVKTLDLFERSGLPIEARPMLPLFTAGILGFFLPQVLGGGESLVNELGKQNLVLTSLLLFVIGKFFFTMFSYSSGVPGGIFLPILVIGALLGNIFGEVVNSYTSFDPKYLHNFIVYAMAAYLTAIIKAPITGSILLTEMAGSFSHLLATLTVSMVAYLVSDLLKSRPVYEILLERIMKREKWDEYSEDSEDKKVILEIPVCLGSVLDRKKVKSIPWPKCCLLVSIIRGTTEIIPKGDTLIHVGDHLIVLTSEARENTVRTQLMQLAGECNTK